MDVNRNIGVGIPFRNELSEKFFKPLFQQFSASGADFGSRLPAVGKYIFWEQTAGQVLAGMEQQGMVFTEEPHNVVSRLVNPIPVI